jgi:imidazolonepropionase-like amidohydrolase
MLTLRFLLAAFAAAIWNVQAAELAFENAIVLDPATESTQMGTLLVRDGHIVELLDSVPSEFQGQRIDLGGRWVIPGLADMHTHAGGNRSPDGQWQMMTPAQVANIALYSGVVAYLDLFNIEDSIFGSRNEQRKTGAIGATIYAVGPCLTATNGHCTEVGVPTRTIDTPADARREIDQLAIKSPDAVKVVYDNCTLGENQLPTIDLPTLEAVAAVAAEHGLRTVVHIGTWGDVRDSVMAGAAAVTHLPLGPVPPDIPALMIERGAVYIPTLVVQSEFARILDDPTVLDDPLLITVLAEPLLDAYRNLDPAMFGWLAMPSMRCGAGMHRDHRSGDLEVIRALSDAGVKILTGTDASNPGAFQGYSVHRELELLVDAGLTHWEALRATTTAPRDFLEARWGVSIGDEATFVVLDGSPLDDIRNTKRIHMVVQRGTVVDREELLSSGLGCVARSLADIDLETMTCIQQDGPRSDVHDWRVNPSNPPSNDPPQ